jgi:PhnB protein
MRLNPHLQFNGQCESAFEFYERCLGGKILIMMRYGESPMAGQTPTDWHGKILHSTFTVAGFVLHGADALPGHYKKPQGFSVMLNIEKAAEAERIFTSLANNGTVQVPLQETFWATRFGMLVDQFATPWTINCGKTREN